MDFSNNIAIFLSVLASFMTVLIGISSYNKFFNSYIINFKRRLIDEIFKQMNFVFSKYSLLVPLIKSDWSKIIEEFKRQKIISIDVRGLIYEYINVLLVLNYNDRKIFKDMLQNEKWIVIWKILNFWKKIAKKFDSTMEQVEKLSLLSFTKEENNFYKKTTYNPLIYNQECMIENHSISVFPDFDDLKVWDINIDFLQIDNDFNKLELDNLIKWKKSEIKKILNSKHFSLNLKIKKNDFKITSTLNFNAFCFYNNGNDFYKIETIFHRNHDWFCNCKKLNLDKEKIQSIKLVDIFNFSKYNVSLGKDELEKLTLFDFINLYNWYISKINLIFKINKKKFIELIKFEKDFECKIFNLILESK